MLNDCYVTFTMDCETIGAESPPGGPADFALAERAVTGYVEALRRRGQAVTLFPVPRLAEVQADILTDLQAEDCELGMHYHPQTIDCGYDGYIAELTAAEQEQMLTDGYRRITDALGTPPQSFRSGNFSASDSTFAVLTQIGFRQGSVSMPGRVLPQYAAEWPGAIPFAHRASATDRLVAGNLDFWEMPTCTDVTQLQPAQTPTDARHIRLETGGVTEWGPRILHRYVQAMVQQAWVPKVVVVMTHNTQEYGQPDCPARQALEQICDALEATIADFDLQMRPMTLADIGATLREAGITGSTEFDAHQLAT